MIALVLIAILFFLPIHSKVGKLVIDFKIKKFMTSPNVP